MKHRVGVNARQIYDGAANIADKGSEVGFPNEIIRSELGPIQRRRGTNAGFPDGRFDSVMAI